MIHSTVAVYSALLIIKGCLVYSFKFDVQRSLGTSPVHSRFCKLNSSPSNSIIDSISTLVQPPNKLNDLQVVGNGIGVTDLFTDCLEEVVKPIPLAVNGSPIPKWLKGSLIRNGPGLFGSVTPKKDTPTDGKIATQRRFNHVFDGLAKLTKFHFNGNGDVDFSTRFIDSDSYRKALQGSTDIYAFVGPNLPPLDTVEKMKAGIGAMVSYDNANVNIHKVGGLQNNGPWVANTDATCLMKFDPLTLSTEGIVKSQDSITSFGGIEMVSTAHSKSKDGYTFNLFTELRPVAIPLMPKSSLIHIVKTDQNMRRTVIGTVETGGADIIPFIHDFSISENYLILCVWPLRQDLAKMLGETGTLKECIWDGDKGVKTKIYVFNISKNRLNSDSTSAFLSPSAEFYAPPMFAYHHINAYEEVEKETNEKVIIMDVNGYDRPDIVNGKHGYAYIDNMMDPELRMLQEREGGFYRFKLPISSHLKHKINDNNYKQKVTPLKLKASAVGGKELSSELITLDPRRYNKKFTHSYGFTGFAGDPKKRFGGYNDWGLVKMNHDLAEKQIKEGGNNVINTALLWHEPNIYPSEAIFVGRPKEYGGTDEDDDGLLLSVCYDGVKKESFLLILDAKNMNELSRCYTGVRCNISFHGQFITNP